MADCGMAATQHLLDDLRKRWKLAGGQGDPRAMLVDALTDLLQPLEQPFAVDQRITLRHHDRRRQWCRQDHQHRQAGEISSAAGRQACCWRRATPSALRREQLAIWGERNNVTVIQQAGGDPAAVMFDAVTAGKARGTDVVMCDTAGRLPTQLHLMDELKRRSG